MKKLMLIRHAKAEKDSGSSDFDRPLKYIGIQDASFMAEKVKEKKLIPQVLISSSALRTKTTADIFTEHLKLPEAWLDKSIYEANQKNLLSVINELPEEFDFIGLVGHNPGIAQILYYLTGEVQDVHTCTVALIAFETNSWKLVSKESGDLIYYDSPKGN
ncbi:phosphohistidine phosphatase SixA [soil metagenome]|jgi:phosphohistidine phosphatase